MHKACSECQHRDPALLLQLQHAHWGSQNEFGALCDYFLLSELEMLCSITDLFSTCKMYAKAMVKKNDCVQY